MVSLKKRARNATSGKFEATLECPTVKRKPGRPKVPKVAARVEGNMQEPQSKRKVGRPKVVKSPTPLTTFEVSITISVGGANVDRELISRLKDFLVEKTISGKCSLERGGTAFHLHFQMVARLEAPTLISISRTIKAYLGWNVKAPPGAMVMCKKVANKGLHTYHGLIGYCMKDARCDHFETVDHNVTAADINLGLEQYALHGQEENKNRIVLTMQNIADRVFMWRKCNCKHPLIVDFHRDLYNMIKTGKYYPAPAWVIGGYGKGYQPFHMQSLYRMMVVLDQINRLDVSNVFEFEDFINQVHVPRRQWFAERWQEQKQREAASPPAVRRSLFEKLQEVDGAAKCLVYAEGLIDVPIVNGKSDVEKAVYCTDLGASTSKMDERRKGKLKVSPTHHLWPEAWNIDELCYTSSSTEQSSSAEYTEMPQLGDYIPLYFRADPPLVVE